MASRVIVDGTMESCLPCCEEIVSALEAMALRLRAVHAAIDCFEGKRKSGNSRDCRFNGSAVSIRFMIPTCCIAWRDRSWEETLRRIEGRLSSV